MILGDSVLNVTAGGMDGQDIRFNSSIYIGATTRGILEILAGLSQNEVRGNAIANFSGDLSHLSFKSDVNIYGGRADGSKLFNFNDAHGGFSAVINGFDLASINDSDLTGAINFANTKPVEINGTSSLDGSLAGSVTTTTINQTASFNLYVSANNQITGSVANKGLFILTPKTSSGTYKIASNVVTGDAYGSLGKLRVNGSATYTSNYLTAGSLRTVDSADIASYQWIIVGTQTSLHVTDANSIVEGDNTSVSIMTGAGQNATVYSVNVGNYLDEVYIADLVPRWNMGNAL